MDKCECWRHCYRHWCSYLQPSAAWQLISALTVTPRCFPTFVRFYTQPCLSHPNKRQRSPKPMVTQWHQRMVIGKLEVNIFLHLITPPDTVTVMELHPNYQGSWPFRRVCTTVSIHESNFSFARKANCRTWNVGHTFVGRGSALVGKLTSPMQTSELVKRGLAVPTPNPTHGPLGSLPHPQFFSATAVSFSKNMPALTRRHRTESASAIRPAGLILLHTMQLRQSRWNSAHSIEGRGVGSLGAARIQTA